MVSKIHRFRGQGGVRYLFRKGDTVRGSLFTLRHFTNSRITTYRVAVVVSKKVSKSAPTRNRIRRRIYEIVRINASKYLQNQDIAFIVFSDKIATMPHEELESAVLEQLSQIRQSS